MIGVAVIGAGLIGSRRASTAAASGRSRVAWVVDLDADRARAVAEPLGARWGTEAGEAVADGDVDAVVVSTVNSQLAPLAVAALEAGKHVLCEKPPGRTAAEAEAMAAAAAAAGRVLKAGFNLRFHPALRRAHQLAAGGEIGELHHVRSVYGHGGRPGYEKEWRGDPAVAGGGELLDQGVHLLDLARWFLGDLGVSSALLATWGWPIEPLEDNAYVLLNGESGRAASLNTSWTLWKNRFTFEVFGGDGYLVVEGLGGSYGPERLTHGRRLKPGAVPEETVTAFDGPDPSWTEDWADFEASILEARPPEVGPEASVAVMRLVDEVYRRAERAGRARQEARA